jgi:predicted phosphodiesterase
MTNKASSGTLNSLTRRQFVAGLGAFFASQLLLPPVLRGATLDQRLKPLRLGFLTDCHTMAEHDAPASLARTAELMNSLKPDLIIGGGDFVHGGFYASGKVMESRWVLVDRFLRQLNARLEPVIGNHDLYEPLLSDGSPAGNDPKWRWKKYFRQNRTYRSFEFQGYRFLMLDSIKVVGGGNPYRGWIDAAQLLWLDQELARIPANQPIILCTHIPFATSMRDSFGPIMGPSPGRVHVINSDLVMKKLRGRPLALIMQGHVHINERLESEGVPCITGGAVCGRWWQGPNMGTYPGLGLIEIHPAQSKKNSLTSEVDWNYLSTPAAPGLIRVA